MIMNATQSRLVLIDFQPRLMAAIDEADFVLKNAQRLAQAAKILQVPAWATEQNPSKLGGIDPVLASLVQETFGKMEFGSGDAGLFERLRSSSAQDTIVVAGCEAHICLLQTALKLKASGFEVVAVSDACGSRTPRNYGAAMARLAGAGCHVVTTEMVLFEWLGSAAHDRFKEVQALIK